MWGSPFLDGNIWNSESLYRAMAGAQLWDNCVSRMSIVIKIWEIKSDKEEKSHCAAVKKAGHETRALDDVLGQVFVVQESQEQSGFFALI